LAQYPPLGNDFSFVISSKLGHSRIRLLDLITKSKILSGGALITRALLIVAIVAYFLHHRNNKNMHRGIDNNSQYINING
jgi:hypothetical protein